MAASSITNTALRFLTMIMFVVFSHLFPGTGLLKKRKGLKK